MIIDDDPIIQFLITKQLRQHFKGINILGFDGAEEALQFLDTNSETPGRLPCLILLDLNMPNMNGFEFMEVFSNRKFAQEIAVYVCSSSTNLVDKEHAAKFPLVKSYFEKPLDDFHFATMEKFIENYLATHYGKNAPKNSTPQSH